MFIKATFGSCKIFSEKYLFSGNAIFRKGKYFQVFGCIMKIFLENNFMCLVTFWKCYFPPPPPQNPPPHNRKTTKTPPPTPPQQQQQNQRSKKESKKSKSQTNFITKISNENENESVRVGSRCEWVRQCEWVCRCEWVRGAMISLLSLLSLRAWSGNGKTISMIGDWVRQGWVWMIGAVRSSCSNAIFLLRRWQSSCSFSLSLFYFPRPEIIWSENENENDFPLFWL